MDDEDFLRVMITFGVRLSTKFDVQLSCWGSNIVTKRSLLVVHGKFSVCSMFSEAYKVVFFFFGSG